MAKKNRERDELRVVQRSWGTYQPLAQTRADFVALSKLLGRESGGRLSGLWGSMRLSTSKDAAGYPKLRVQIHILGPSHALAEVFEALPNIRSKRRKGERPVDVQQVLLAEEANEVDRAPESSR